MAASSSNTALVPTANIVFAGTGANRTVTVTPALNQTGTATITVTALDAAGGTARSTFTLTVTARPSTYTFFGYLSPLMTAGTDAQPSVSGVFNLGSAIPLKWQLKEGATFVSDLRTLRTHRGGPGHCFTREQRMSAEWWRSHPAAGPGLRQADRQQHLPVRRDRQAVHLQLGHERRNEGQLLSFEDPAGRWQCGEGHRRSVQVAR